MFQSDNLTQGPSNHAYWYGVIVGFVVASMTVLLWSPDVFLFRIVRAILGSIMLLFLPGYSFMRAFFPYHKRKAAPSHEPRWERLGFSLILSLVIVPILGFLLNYSPWGISLTPLTLIIGILIIAFSSIALVREEQANKSNET